MTISKNKWPIICGGLFTLFLLLSLLLYILMNPHVKRILFFPQISSNKLIGEERYLPNRNNLEKNIELLLEEIILGPSQYKSKTVAAVPRNTELESILVDKDTAHLSFSNEILFLDENSPLKPREVLQAIANSIIFNFPHISRVFIYIHGQPLLEYGSTEEEGKEFNEGIQFSNSILK